MYSSFLISALATTHCDTPAFCFSKEERGDIFVGLTQGERVSVIMQVLNAPYPAHFFLFLSENKQLAPYFSILAEAHNIPAGPPLYHDGSVIKHLAYCMNAVAGDALAVWMALCHDLGKCTTEKDILPKHIGHEVRGTALAEELGQNLGMPEEFIFAGAFAVKWHMKAGRYGQARPGTRRDLLMAVQDAGLWEPFWKLVDADKKEKVSRLAYDDVSCINGIIKNNLTEHAWREAQCTALAERMRQKR